MSSIFLVCWGEKEKWRYDVGGREREGVRLGEIQ